MADLSVAKRIIAEKTVCVLLVRGTDPKGERIYAYVAVRADKLDGFIAAQKAGLFHPEEYGLILAAGSGDPPADVRERMTREYGFDHDGMLDLPDVAKAEDVMSNLTNLKQFEPAE